MEEQVNQVMKAEATFEAMNFLLQSNKELEGVEYIVDKNKTPSMGKIIDEGWDLEVGEDMG